MLAPAIVLEYVQPDPRPLQLVTAETLHGCDRHLSDPARLDRNHDAAKFNAVCVWIERQDEEARQLAILQNPQVHQMWIEHLLNVFGPRIWEDELRGVRRLLQRCKERGVVDRCSL